MRDNSENGFANARTQTRAHQLLAKLKPTKYFLRKKRKYLKEKF